MNTHVISAQAWERMVTAVEKVRDRLRRAVQALERAVGAMVGCALAWYCCVTGFLLIDK
ncbi:MAG: hypothetical protein U0793_33650 [Gemmataceae bacterium]